MRILYVTRQYPPHGVGGIGSYVATLAGMMRAADHDVTVLSVAPGQRRSTTWAGGVRVERVPALGPARLWDALHRRSWPAASRLHGALGAAWGLARLRGRFDVVEAPEWKAEGLLLRWCRKGPVVVHLHLAQELVRRWSGGPRPGRGTALAEWLERRTVGAARAVTATSELSRTLPGGQRWLPSVPVTVVPPPVDPGWWAGCPPVAATDPVVLFVGHLEHRKAPEVLLDALGLLARRDAGGLRAVFVGRPFTGPGGVPYDQHLRSRARALGVACEVLAPRPDPAAMRHHYGTARVVVVPSRYETLSMVALEAAACGRPVVMTEAVGATEWLDGALSATVTATAPGAGDAGGDAGAGDVAAGDRHDAGLVVPAGDPAALAAALGPLLADPGRAHRLGERGRAAVARACAPDEVVARRAAVYQSGTPVPIGAAC